MAGWIVETVDAVLGEGQDPAPVVTLPTQDTTITLYDAPEGAVVDDLEDEQGNPMTELTVPAGDPYIPVFYGPDGVTTLWANSANGAWLPIPQRPTVEDLEGDYLARTGDNVYEYASADASTEPYLVVKVPSQGTLPSTQWPNRLEFQYYDDSTSQYRVGFHLNEKCLLRVRGVTPEDVAVRFIAHASLNPTWPVMEVTGNNSQDPAQKYFQVFEHSTRSYNGVTLPYIQNPNGERLYFGTADPATDAAYADHRPNIGDGWIDYVNGGGE